MAEELKTSRTQVQRREEAVRKILDAAIELIAQRGVKDLTMAEVGIHAGYSRGLPHQHFGSKENLIDAVLHAIVEKFNQRLVLHLFGARSCRLAGLQGVHHFGV